MSAGIEAGRGHFNVQTADKNQPTITKKYLPGADYRKGLTKEPI
jgi:hypothetical protein